MHDVEGASPNAVVDGGRAEPAVAELRPADHPALPRGEVRKQALAVTALREFTAPDGVNSRNVFGHAVTILPRPVTEQDTRRTKLRGNA